MTAEVTVMNCTGVALAADSAVTIGHQAKKIYTSAEKLFQLSNHAPVGIMIYGNANFVGIPWETIIKEYRKSLGTKVFPRLEDYTTDFLRFINKNRLIFPKKRQIEEAVKLIWLFYNQLLDGMARKLDTEAEGRDGLTDDDLKPILSNVVEKCLSDVKNATLLPGHNSKTTENVRRTFSKHIRELKSQVFGDLPFSVAANRQLTSIAIELLVRDYFGSAKSGVVFSGYGEQEYLPVVIHYEFEDMVLNRARCLERNRQITSEDSPAAVMPFAQQDMVYSFMQGITHDLQKFYSTSAARLILGMASSIVNEIEKSDKTLAEKIERNLNKQVPVTIRDLFSRWSKKQEIYWQPVLQIVSTLPKDELAAMAENLVNLTKFRRRVTAVHETVGGPIDIALITKGDGFIWIKRKHYFDPKFNPRVMAKLGKEKPE